MNFLKKAAKTVVEESNPVRRIKHIKDTAEERYNLAKDIVKDPEKAAKGLKNPKVSSGPVQFSKDGVDFDPYRQRVGVETENFQGYAGWDDIRQPQNFRAEAKVFQRFKAEGNSLRECLEDMRRQTREIEKFDALDDLESNIHMLLLDEVFKLQEDVMEMSDITWVKQELTVTAAAVGYSGSAGTGQKDKDGYRWYGATGTWSKGMSWGAGVMFGVKKHEGIKLHISSGKVQLKTWLECPTTPDLPGLPNLGTLAVQGARDALGV